MFNMLPPGHLSRIAFTPSRGSLVAATQLAKAFPAVEVLVWDNTQVAPSVPNMSILPIEGVREMLGSMLSGGKVQVIVDLLGDRTTFKNLFFALTEGGTYIFPDSTKVPAAAYVASIIAAKMGGSAVDGDERNLIPWIRSVRFIDNGCVVEKAGHHVFKLRDETANSILGGKAYGGRTRIIDSIPSGKMENRATITTNNKALHAKRIPQTIDYPEAVLRSYTGVNCYPGQVYVMADVMLPDSFRQIRAHRLSSRAIRDSAQWHADMPASPAIMLTGTYYALDSEVPGHFGHFTSEVLARVWGWTRAKLEYPEIKALVSLEPGRTNLPVWQRDMLAAAGIDQTDIFTINEAVHVERLIAATPLFSNPKYIHPQAIDYWQSAGNALISPLTEKNKIFVSRKALTGRGCINSEDVEHYFVAKGFTVIYPEDYSASDQASLFNNAETIAGFAGSGMFSLIFAQKPKKVILIGSESYDAINEILFMAGAGGSLTYLWCTPRIPMGDRWSLESFLSDYEFDFERDGKLLDAATS